jgi:hypothetical protein
MAIFENFDKFPEVSDGDLALQCRRQVYAEDWNAVKQFRGWVYSHRSVDNKWVLDEAIKRIIPSPHEMSLRSFPTILNFVDHCPQEYFALITRTYFIYLSKTAVLIDRHVLDGFKIFFPTSHCTIQRRSTKNEM